MNKIEVGDRVLKLCPDCSESKPLIDLYKGHDAYPHGSPIVCDHSVPILEPCEECERDTLSDECQHWREGNSDNCLLCGDDLGPTAMSDVTTTESLANNPRDERGRILYLVGDVVTIPFQSFPGPPNH